MPETKRPGLVHARVALDRALPELQTAMAALTEAGDRGDRIAEILSGGIGKVRAARRLIQDALDDGDRPQSIPRDDVFVTLRAEVDLEVTDGSSVIVTVQDLATAPIDPVDLFPIIPGKRVVIEAWEPERGYVRAHYEDDEPPTGDLDV